MTSEIDGRRLISFGLLFITLSYCGAKTDPVESETRRLELDIPSLYLINGMFFSADQTKQLADFLTESAKIHEENQRAIRQFILNHQKETDLLLDQMITGKKEETRPSSLFPKGKPNRRLYKVRNEWQSLINRNQHSLDEIAEKILAMLTPAQRDILDRFVPCFIPPGDFRNPERVGQAGADTSLGETMLARLRRSPPAKLNDAIERSLDGLVPYIMKEQHAELTKPQIEELRAELRPSLKELTDRIRGMNDSDFELEKATLARQFLCLQNAEPDNKGGDNSGKIKRYILNPGIASVIARRAGDPDFGKISAAADFNPEITPAALIEDVKQKTETFQAAALINTLQLTAGQSRQLLPWVQKAIAARVKITREASASYPQALKAYTALKKELENQQNSPQTEQEAAQYHHELKMLYLDKLTAALLECEAEMDRILSADQVALLSSRPAGKRNEHQTNDPAQKNIELVRSRARELFDVMDSKDFNANTRELSAKFVERIISIGALAPDAVDKNAEIFRTEQVLSRARSMKHSEYLKARDDLIAEICPRRNKPRPAMFCWQKSMGAQLEVVNPSTELILSQAGLTVLEKKIKSAN